MPELLKLEDLRVDTWEELARNWTDNLAVFDAPAKVKLDRDQIQEMDVSAKVVVPLFRLLGWPGAKIFGERTITRKYGRDEKGVRVDFVLAEGFEESRQESKPWAVIEVKRNITAGEAQDVHHQAESYALFLRVPYYIVVDKHKIEVWQRYLLTEDEKVVELEAATMGPTSARARLIEILHHSKLPTRVAADRAQERKPIAEGGRRSPPLSTAAPTDAPLDRRIRLEFNLVDDKLQIKGATEANIASAEWWWGRWDSKDIPPTTRVVLVGTRTACHPLLEALDDVLARLLWHGAIHELRTGDPAEWRRAVEPNRLLFRGALARAEAIQQDVVGYDTKQDWQEGDCVKMELTTWIEQLQDSMDDWMVSCARADWVDFTGIQQRFHDKYSGVETWGAPQDDQVKAQLKTALGDLSQLTTDLLARAFRPQSDSADRDRVVGRLHLGPHSRSQIFGTLLFAAVIKAVSEGAVALGGKASQAQQNSNLTCTASIKPGLLAALDCIESTKPFSSESVRSFRRWAVVLALRTPEAMQHQLAGQRAPIGEPALEKPLGWEAIGSSRGPGRVFVFDRLLRDAVLLGTWNDVRAALNGQLKAHVSRSNL